MAQPVNHSGLSDSDRQVEQPSVRRIWQRRGSRDKKKDKTETRKLRCVFVFVSCRVLNYSAWCKRRPYSPELGYKISAAPHDVKGTGEQKEKSLDSTCRTSFDNKGLDLKK